MSLTHKTLAATPAGRRGPTLASRPRRTVELRAWRSSDAASLQAILAEGDDLQFPFGPESPATVEGCQAIIERSLAVSLPSLRNFAVSISGRAVGNIGVSHIEHRYDTGWMSYWLATDFRGRGLATRALATVAGWAFAEQDLFRLELGHRTTNSASCRVAARAAFATEGVERQKLKCGAQRFDVETHARLRTDRYPQVELMPIR